MVMTFLFRFNGDLNSYHILRSGASFRSPRIFKMGVGTRLTEFFLLLVSI